MLSTEDMQKAVCFLGSHMVMSVFWVPICFPVDMGDDRTFAFFANKNLETEESSFLPAG